MKNELVLFLDNMEKKKICIETFEYMYAKSVVNINNMNYEINNNILYIKDGDNGTLVSICLTDIIEITCNENQMKLYLDLNGNSYITLKL